MHTLEIRRLLGLLLTATLVAVLGCSDGGKPRVDPEIAVLKKRLEAATKRMEDLRIEARTLQSDPFSGPPIAEETALMASRIERIKYRLTELGASPAGSSVDKASGGGGH